MKKLAYQETVDILVGCTILGTGGGGSLAEGLDAVKKAFGEGCEFNMIDFDEIKDDAYYVNPYFCGSISPDEEEEEEHKELEYAIRSLEEYMDVEFDGVVSIEYGGGNTGQAMAAGARAGKFIVDADAAGRAVPELQFSTYFVTGRPIYPFSVATKHKDTVIFTKVASDARAEVLSRMMAVATDNTVGMADHPIIGKDLKTSVIPNALSYAGKVGRIQREALEKGLNPIAELTDKCEGTLLFEGIVTEKDTEWNIQDGFTVGSIGIKGCESFENSAFKVWYKNENMVAWRDGEVALTCPDLICVVNGETGYPITNPNCNPGNKVAVLGFKAHDFWKTEKGLSILNPRFFGFDIDVKYL
ncbi:hypothetical protein SAMN02745751_02072 [Dethiosulfatibacter aminovorans DSM 17477]|uniref:DUF917 domain-containing protein n=1 Tax=Dethiosulfatibacter aminovorans DSM 17477 TaxID=1121476 RepID=A0A1M6HR10_9FIRM|nr:DUF917 domain-containing protein [Dethiosulfatibacter aminovorans]SHJ24639.1 hypothetical protein SAMN02745751_02072 [Dethiosulfatibacter aminovorans DSM 17477]